MVITVIGENHKKELLDIEEIVKNKDFEEILDYVGKGLCATVYAYDDFAVKIFNGDKGSYKFRDEDYIFLSLLKDSRYVPNIYGYEKELFIVNDYIEGCTLSDLEEYIEDGFFSNEILSTLTSKVSMQMKSFLEDCKALNIIPYDLHEDNIMLNEKGDIMIVDTGYFYLFSRDISRPNYKTEKDIEQGYECYNNTILKIENYINQII